MSYHRHPFAYYRRDELHECRDACIALLDTPYETPPPPLRLDPCSQNNDLLQDARQMLAEVNAELARRVWTPAPVKHPWAWITTVAVMVWAGGIGAMGYAIYQLAWLLGDLP